MTAREAAFLSLQKYRGSGKYSNIELSGSIERLGLEGAEKALYTALFYGVIEREITLDYFISRLSERKIDDIDRDVRTILELGIYQLEYMDKIPESAAVNESVKLARRFYARKNSEAFINALLRNFIRERKNISLPKKEDNYIKYRKGARGKGGGRHTLPSDDDPACKYAENKPRRPRAEADGGRHSVRSLQGRFVRHTPFQPCAA